MRKAGKEVLIIITVVDLCFSAENNIFEALTLLTILQWRECTCASTLWDDFHWL